MKTVIELTREADVYCTTRQQTLDAMLERLVELVRADEREALAQAMHAVGLSEHISKIAEAIRARGQA